MAGGGSVSGGRWATRLPRGDARLALVATLAVLVVFAGAGLVAVSRSWVPVSDWALLEAQVRNVGGSHTPLTGAYSRFGWNHPGSWMFWLLAVPYRLGGSSPNGLLVGAVLLEAIAVVGAVRVAWRRGGLALTLLLLAGLSTMTWAIGLRTLFDPWNPWLTLLPLTWFALLAWDAACGHRWSVPVAAAVGSFAVGCHVGVLGLVAGFSLAGAVLLVVRGREVEADGPSWWRIGAVTAAALAVLWGPALIDQLTADQGNLARIGSFVLDGGRETAGWAEGAEVLARESGGWAPWIGGPEPTGLVGGVVGRPVALLLVPACLLALTALAGRLRRRSDLVAAAVVGAAGLVAACWAIATVTGPVYLYLVRWTWSLALFVHVMAAWAVVLLVAGRRDVAEARAVRVPPWLGWAATAIFAGAAVLTVAQGADARGPRSDYADAVEALVPPAVQWADGRGDGPVLVQSLGGRSSIPAALVLALDRAGRDVLVSGPLAIDYPDHQRYDGEHTAATLVVAGPDEVTEVAARPHAVRLASDPGLPGDDEAPPLVVFGLPAA